MRLDLLICASIFMRHVLCSRTRQRGAACSFDHPIIGKALTSNFGAPGLAAAHKARPEGFNSTERGEDWLQCIWHRTRKVRHRCVDHVEILVCNTRPLQNNIEKLSAAMNTAPDRQLAVLIWVEPRKPRILKPLRFVPMIFCSH